MIHTTQRRINLWVSMPTFRLFSTLVFIALMGSLINATWWNSNFTSRTLLQINSTAVESVPQVQDGANCRYIPISLNTSDATLFNKTTNCLNVRFINGTDNGTLAYQPANTNTTFCGNATNNMTFYVCANLSSNATFTNIYAYAGNLSAAAGNNSSAVWGTTGANVSAYYTGESLISETGVNNLSAVNVSFVNNASCRIGSCFYFNATNSQLYNTTATLQTGTGSYTELIWASKSQQAIAGTNSYRPLIQIGSIGTQQLQQLIWSGTTSPNGYSSGIWGIGSNIISVPNSSILGLNLIGARGGNSWSDVFFNGSNNSNTLATNLNGNNFTIGYYNGGSPFYWTNEGVGFIDEIEYTSKNRSLGWMQAANASITFSGWQSQNGTATANYTYNESDTIAYQHILDINLSGTGYTDANFTSFSINGVAYSPSVSKSSNVTDVFLTLTATPPSVTTTTLMNVAWNYQVYNSTDFNSVSASYTINVSSGGMFLCNATYPTSSFNYSFYDITTGAKLNASLVASFQVNSSSTSTKTTAVSQTNNTTSICIAPSNATYAVTSNEYVNFTGYTPASITRSITASNVSQNFSIGLYNSTTTYSTQISVLQYPTIPISGVVVSVYQYTAPSNYTLVKTCTTQNDGTCLVDLIPNTIFYLYNFTYAGTPYSFGAQIITCTSGSAVCYQNFIINPSTIPAYLGGTFTGSCNFNSGTRLLSCTSSTSGSTITRLNMSAYSFGNSTPKCTQTSTSANATLTCTMPNVNGTYSFSFVGYDSGGNPYVLSGGNFAIGTSSNPDFGASGWLAVLIIVGIFALAAAGNLGMSMAFAVLGLLIGAMFGFVPMGSIQQIIVVVATMAGILIWRLRV